MIERRKIRDLQNENAALHGKNIFSKKRIELLEKHNEELVKDYGELLEDYKELISKHEKLKESYILKNNELIGFRIQQAESDISKRIKGEKKMTNFEYYKDEILKHINSAGRIALMDGKLSPCFNISCEDCDLSVGSCGCEIVKWFYEEHIKEPKLTKKERMFCELVEIGWIARDKDGELYFHTFKPAKGQSQSIWRNEHPASTTCLNDFRLQLDFDFIKWEDEEPWSVQKLLKLEVEE